MSRTLLAFAVLVVAGAVWASIDSGPGISPPDSRCASWRVSAGNPGEGAGATEFMGVSDTGGLVPNATEANVDQIITPIALEFADLRVLVDVAPDNGGGTQSRQITLRDDVADTGITCTISEAETSCTYSGAAVLIAAGSKLAWELTNTGTPATAGEINIASCSSP